MASIREKDSISRLGGDEFAVLLPQTDFEGAKFCAERILKAMDAPFCINRVSTESKASIGIAIFPEHGNNAEELMQHADIAMYQAKKLQSGFAIYDPAQNKHSMRRLKLMNDLKQYTAWKHWRAGIMMKSATSPPMNSFLWQNRWD